VSAPGGQPLAGVRLADLTTLRLGGPAAATVRVDTGPELVDVVRDLDARGEQLLLVGGGSNLVVADEGFPGTVVLVRNRGVASVGAGAGEVDVTVSAGEPWDDVVLASVQDGFGQLAALSGIPGLAGATPIQNVGAYGQEVASVVRSVRVLDRSTGAVEDLGPAQCGFGYRDSAFKRDRRHVVLAVTLRLRRAARTPVTYAELARSLGVPVGAVAPASAVREAVLDLRRSKAMVIEPVPSGRTPDPDTVSAGSFFTNPVLAAAAAGTLPADAPRFPAGEGHLKVSAAWLIEGAGFSRGYGHGAARISGRHALALTNRGGASTAELLALAGEIVAGVRDRYGVTLVLEPVLVGCALP
jgi:UDP-N-acetylmuramate dehydrogenase